MTKKDKELEVSTDVTPFSAFFRFTPAAESPQTGKACTPLMGEVEPGGVYEVNDQARAQVLAGHPEWGSVSERVYKDYLKASAGEDQED